MGLIRLFLALSVVVWHMPDHSFTLINAQEAVFCFFILSGFYMALTINQSYAKQGARPAPGWRRAFYLSRACRLYPTYLLIQAAVVIWFGLDGTANVYLSRPDLPVPAFLGLVFMNVFIVGQDFFQLIISSVYHEEANPITQAVIAATPIDFFQGIWMLINPAWSLAMEILFYAVAPFIVRSVRRLTLCLAISLALRFFLIFGLHGFSSTIWGYKFFPCTICMFCLGSLSYHLYPRLADSRMARRAGAAISVAFAAFALISMLLWHEILPVDRYGLDAPWLWLAYLLFALSLPPLFCCWRRNRLDRLAGELSFPLYLVHGIVLGLIFGHMPAGQITREVAAITISLAAAAAIFIFIERPVDAWRHRHFNVSAQKTTVKRRMPREWFVLAGIVTAILVNTLRLAAFAQPVLSPPGLLTTFDHYNIVTYGGRMYAGPFGDNVNWYRRDFDRDPRLITGTKLSDIEQRIAQVPAPAQLLQVVGHYNVVRYDGRVFAGRQGTSINWGAPGYEHSPGLITAPTVPAVLAAIARVQGPLNSPP
jgi:peptidoglycan/LPS O-acetylase OafA/YrhL